MIEKFLKFLGASIGVLVAAYTIGWSGALALHALFKTERTEAQAFVKDSIEESESKISGIHNADINGIHTSFGIVIKQNENIMRQNTEILKRLPKE